MIGYYSFAIIALSLNYFHSTNAGSSFHDDVPEVKRHLRKEREALKSLKKTVVRNLAFWKRKNIVCDLLTEKEKESLCDKINHHMMDYFYGDIFVSFVEPDDNPSPLPQLIDPNKPYSCKKIPILDVDMAKRMFWCKSRMFLKGGESPGRQREEGFFCAGSRETKGRVYVLGAARDGQHAHVIGQVDNVSLIMDKVAGVPAKDNSPTTSPTSSASSEIF